MGTYVRMTPRPWRPAAELDAALDRGDLRFALSLAEELRIEGKPISLATACKFLPLVARERPGEYDHWALRWLRRWAESASSIHDAVDVAALLAELPSEEAALSELTRLLAC